MSGSETDMGALGDVFKAFFETDPTEESLRSAVDERAALLRRAEARVVKAREDLDRAGEHLSHFLAGVRAAEKAAKQ